MQKPQPTTGSAPARASESSPSATVRAGQVPRGERPRARLCILATHLPLRGDEVDEDACRARLAALARLGFGLALGLAPAEREVLGAERLLALAQRVAALGLGQPLVVGAGNEPAGGAAPIGEQIQAALAQTVRIEEAGGIPLVLPFASLSRRRCREAEYVEVYKSLLARVAGPVLLDWSGPPLRPELLDYFPGKSFESVMALDPAKVLGARFALLDVPREVRLRRELLTRDQLLLTADRGHLAHLLLGANPGTRPARVPEPLRHRELAGSSVALGDFSHALLELPAGLDPEAAAAQLADALECLAAGDAVGTLERMPALG